MHPFLPTPSRPLSLLLVGILSACGPLMAPTPAPLKVHATSSAFPWLSTAYDCAPASSVIVLTDEADADVVFRLSEPHELAGPAYQIGSDDLVVITHPQVGVGSLPLSQVEALFSGQVMNWNEVGGSDQGVQVWVYAPGVDVETYFDRIVLHDRPVSSLARLAVSAQHMSDSVGAVSGSIGFLPRRWKAGNTREAMTVGSVPVLAIPREAAQGALASLIGCMQTSK